MKKIDEVEISGKKVLATVEFNVPVENGNITDEMRIIQSLDTLKFIINQKPKILLLVSHLGRPDGKIVPELGLEPVRKRLEELLEISVEKIDILSDLEKIKKEEKEGVYLLENIRFWKEEEAGDEKFGKKIANGFDVYVNENFSTSHRKHASFVQFPKFIPEKCAGFLFWKEYEKLSVIKNNPNHPAVMVIGGAKIETKLPVIENIRKIYDFVLVGGMIANEALDGKMNLGENVLLPIDFLPRGKENERLDIGEKTISIYKEKISLAETIIWNGPMGKFEDIEAEVGTKEITKEIAKNKSAMQVTGGGETLEAVRKFAKFEDFDYVSMSGGAMLEFLSGKELPGILALEK